MFCCGVLSLIEQSWLPVDNLEQGGERKEFFSERKEARKNKNASKLCDGQQKRSYALEG